MRSREGQLNESASQTSAGAALVVAELHRPVSIHGLPQTAQSLLTALESKLRNCLLLPKPTYEQFSHFAHQHAVEVRPEIASAICSRDVPHSMSSEGSAAERFQRDRARFQDSSIYDVAREIRAAAFGYLEPMRTASLTITYLPWVRLMPPGTGDPLHTPLRELRSGSFVLDALNLFLVLLSAHPFSDGNGRTARILVNVFLSWRYQLKLEYLPLAELIRAGNGALEELLARGNISGDYTPALCYLIELVSAYCDFRAEVETNTVLDVFDHLQSYLRSPGAGRQYDLNKIPPFLIAVQDLAKPVSGGPFNLNFVAAINRFASALAPYGSVIFAMTTLEELAGENSQRSRSVTFFIRPHRKEELLLRYRQMRCAEPEIENLEVALWMDEPLLNAKVLINLAKFYDDGTQKATLVMLHGFSEQEEQI